MQWRGFPVEDQLGWQRTVEASGVPPFRELWPSGDPGLLGPMFGLVLPSPMLDDAGRLVVPSLGA